MKTFFQNAATAIVVMLLVGAGYVFANSPGQPGLIPLSERLAANMTRSCIYPPGGWTTIDSDNSGANLSGELNDWTTYAIQCDADAYVAWGGTAAAADSSDGWLAAGAIVRFSVGDDRYVSVLNRSDATADCHYIECK